MPVEGMKRTNGSSAERRSRRRSSDASPVKGSLRLWDKLSSFRGTWSTLNPLARGENVFQVDYRGIMSTIMDMKVKAWSPAVPCKVPDNIVSSQFASQKVFVPSYEKDKRPCIEQLLTNEYQRIWWEEKESWDKMYSRKVTTKKLLQRKVVRKKPQTAPVMDKPKKSRKPKKTKKKGEVVAESKSIQKEKGKNKEKEKEKKKEVTCLQEEGATKKTEERRDEESA